MNGNKVINDEFERTALMAQPDRRPLIGVALIVLGLVLLAVLLVASSRPAGAAPAVCEPPTTVSLASFEPAGTGRLCYCLPGGRARCKEGTPTKSFQLYCKVVKR